MKFSLFMMPLHHPTESPSLAFDRDISLIHLADELLTSGVRLCYFDISFLL